MQWEFIWSRKTEKRHNPKTKSKQAEAKKKKNITKQGKQVIKGYGKSQGAVSAVQ